MQRVIGVDENGLGPRLGPLLATAATIEVRRYDREALRALGDELGIGDSKQVSAFGRMAHAEGLALAVAAAGGAAPKDVDALFAALSIDGLLSLRAPCPDAATSRQCWSSLALPAFGGDLAAGEAMLSALGRAGVRLSRVRSAIACAGVFNEWVAGGQSKLALDLHLFERLLLDGRASAQGDVTAICGMVGGIRRYASRLTRLGEVAIVEETKGLSRYHASGLGSLSFEVSADDRHLPVGLASMIGKYLRELAMARLVGFYRAHDDSLPVVSGYHDPVTRRFVDSSADLRRKLGVVGSCFERNG